ncbi:hypothetical protein J3F84DRAFT_380336 [Trichoderma pleuroticola]
MGGKGGRTPAPLSVDLYKSSLYPRWEWMGLDTYIHGYAWFYFLFFSRCFFVIFSFLFALLTAVPRSSLRRLPLAPNYFIIITFFLYLSS